GMALGAATLVAIILLRRWLPRWPAFLIVIVLASAAAALCELPVETVGDRFPNMPAGVPATQIPQFSIGLAKEVLPSAFVIAFLAGLEALLSAVVADGMTGRRHRSGQELVGVGVANIASAAFGGIPATGAIARTATNIRAGAVTPVAGISHALFILLFMLVAGDWLALVPMAALAAVLLMVAWGMSEAGRFAELARSDVGEGSILVLTFLLTIFVDLTVAIGVGVTLAALLFMARMSEHAGLVAIDADEEPELRKSLPEGVEVFRFPGPIFFGVASEMLDALGRSGQRPRAIIMRMELVPYIDTTGANALRTFVRQALQAGADVVLCGLQREPLEFLARMTPRYAGASQAATWHGALAKVQR
ncbi:MAG: SulP family inorganic anion transporter, partial [Sphingomicrobium sp.]